MKLKREIAICTSALILGSSLAAYAQVCNETYNKPVLVPGGGCYVGYGGFSDCTPDSANGFYPFDPPKDGSCQTITTGDGNAASCVDHNVNYNTYTINSKYNGRMGCADPLPSDLCVQSVGGTYDNPVFTWCNGGNG